MYIDLSGVTHHRDGATPGFTLFSPMQSNTVYLIDKSGEVAHTWSVTGKSTNWCQLLPNGNLLMNEKGPGKPPIRFSAGAIREYDWDGNIVWEHLDEMQHHDARRLPNGGCVYAAWELIAPEVAASIGGGIPGTETEHGCWGEVIREVDESGAVVWEWRVTDLDFEAYPFYRNAARKNYGHCNTVDVLPNGDYLLSMKVLNLLLIVSRETGKVIWEFQHDSLGGQHDVQMTAQGTILVFANGTFSPDLIHSQVWEIERNSKEVVWRYTEPRNPMNFFSTHISGVQRLASGNTLICEGAKGCIIEVTPDNEMVWQYVNPNWAPHPVFKNINWMYRARHYAPDSAEIAGRV